MSKYQQFKEWMASMLDGSAMECHLNKAIDGQSHSEIKSSVESGEMSQEGAASIIASIAYADHCTAELVAERDALKSEINDQENELNEYRNVMAECRKRLGLAEDADGFDVFTAIGKAVAELAALKAAQEWRGMESAPMDGTRILTIDADFDPHEGADVARYTGAFGGAWLDNSKHIPKTIYPTHWMPLPTPPETDK